LRLSERLRGLKRRLAARLRLRWWRWTLLLLVPLCLINVSVSVFGRCRVFPLSPFYLRYKLSALAAYAWHRPHCVFVDDAPMEPLLARAELRHRLPCGLLGAIVQVESGGRPHRISSAGAMGPMQLIPPTARALGVNDPFDPEESLDGAARYLAAHLATFHSVRLAAAAYNAGPGSIVGRAVPKNGQTEIYVERVLLALAIERRARCVPPPPRASAVEKGAPVVNTSSPTCPVQKIRFTKETGCRNDGSVEFCLPANDKKVRAAVKGIARKVENQGRQRCDPKTELLFSLPVDVESGSCVERRGGMTDRAWGQVCALARLPQIRSIRPTIHE
jgi:hypothetical protein